jgi:hypothetical protein
MADDGEERHPAHVRCAPCGHVWIAAYTPMELGAFARVLKSVTCPNCAAGSTHIRLASNREPAHG